MATLVLLRGHVCVGSNSQQVMQQHSMLGGRTTGRPNTAISCTQLPRAGGEALPVRQLRPLSRKVPSTPTKEHLLLRAALVLMLFSPAWFRPAGDGS